MIKIEHIQFFSKSMKIWIVCLENSSCPNLETLNNYILKLLNFNDYNDNDLVKYTERLSIYIYIYIYILYLHR